MKLSVKLDGDQVIVRIAGKVTAQELDNLKAGVSEPVAKWPDKQWIVECKELRYIASSGLRWVLFLQKKLSKKIQFIDVSQSVMDTFRLTGFDKLFSAEKKLRRISVKECDLVGRGANGEVYRLKDETIVKAFFPGVDLEHVEKEDLIAHEVFTLGLPVVIPYGTVEIDDGRYGIVYETLGNKTLSEKIEEEPERIDEWLAEYVNLYRLIHETDGSRTSLPSVKDVYRRHLYESADWYSKEEMDLLLRLLDSIPDRTTLTHGDFHPNNIMISEGELIMIDLGDFSIGHPVFDFLATAATQANLVDLAPEYAELHTRMKAERIRKGWSTLLERSFPDRTPEELKRIDQ